ncbi:flagellar hook-length control protein FliK [Viridibacterium curvum]|uniref:flagellar hook-length control protein FliK n=1 Tax=Viridibacterium curvum TaxID=1101404 RepID=UPI0031E97A23
MIPTEIATRLQLLLNEELGAVDRVRPLPADLPQLDRGARFMARIQEALPDGTYKAMVADHQVTLALPESAKSGDVLELIVTGRTQNMVTARIATLLPEATQPSAQPSISQTGQLISQLLTGRHTPAQTMALNASAPLVAEPPQTAANLVPALKTAVAQSGLFYEAHQAQWVAGKLPLEALMQEPQARTPPLPPPAAEQASSQTPSPAQQPSPPEATLINQRQTVLQPQTLNAAGVEANPAAPNVQRPAVDADGPALSQSPQRVAEPLMPVVHQQLDTLATNQAVWQGMAWPGQPIQWEISESSVDDREQRRADDEEGTVWQSTLRMQMPLLGNLEARLVITSAGVAIRLDADSDEIAARLQSGSEHLSVALAAAGVTMTGFAAVHEHSQGTTDRSGAPHG